LSEVGRESGNIARASCGALDKNLCDAENRIDGRRLVPVARLLCCVHLDAAMHNRGPGTSRELGFDFRIEQAQHQSNPVDRCLRCRFERRRSLKAKRRLVVCVMPLFELGHHEFPDDREASKGQNDRGY
jgi:hypothetical protein